MPRLLTPAQISHIKASHHHHFWGIIQHFAPYLQQDEFRDTISDKTDAIEYELYGDTVAEITPDNDKRIQLWFNALCHLPLFLRHASNLPAPKLQTKRRRYAT
jgi:hypothetical protein